MRNLQNRFAGLYISVPAVRFQPAASEKAPPSHGRRSYKGDSMNLFEGKNIRFTSSYEGDEKTIQKWRENSEYLVTLDTDTAKPKSLKEITKSLDETEPYEFFIRKKDDDKLLGTIALFRLEWNNRTAYLSIGIGDKEHRGKGYGTEAISLMLRYAFCELNLHRVTLDVISNNPAGIRCYQKVGFVEEGRLRECVYRNGQRYDLIYMGILKKEWLALMNPA